MVTRQVTVRECMGQCVRGREASAAVFPGKEGTVRERSSHLFPELALSEGMFAGDFPHPDPIAQSGPI